MTAKLVLVRIDDRLIHGQVVVGWVKAVAPEEIVVANDFVVEDPIQRNLMELAIPASLAVSFCRVRDVAAVCNAKALEGRRTLVLFASARDAVVGVESGLPVKEIDVGNLRFAPGRRQIMNAVAIDAQDETDFRTLLGKGIRVVVQMVPTDDPLEIGKFLR